MSEDQNTMMLIETCLRLGHRVKKLETALVRLRDCDWVITPRDRMDAVREIAREALAGVDELATEYKLDIEDA